MEPDNYSYTERNPLPVSHEPAPAHLRLTSVETGVLWSQYMSDSMALCMMKVFLEKAEDKEIESVIRFAMGLSEDHLQNIKTLFDKEGMPVPLGYTDNDINTAAPRLFSDFYVLYYIHSMSKAAIQIYGTSLPMTTRQDVRRFLRKCIVTAMELDEKAILVLLSKGLYIKAPYPSVADKAEFIRKPGYLGTFFSSQRILNGTEIMHLTANIQTTSLGLAMFRAFHQVAKSSKARHFFFEGIKIAREHLLETRSFFIRDGLPVPRARGIAFTGSTTAPFSDKLMIFQTIFLCSWVIGNFGGAISSCLRKDVSRNFIFFIKDLMRYIEDGTKILIAFNWLERPPQAADYKGTDPAKRNLH